jgi:hypothetical protein
MKTALKMFGSIAAVVAAALISQGTAAAPQALSAPIETEAGAIGMSVESEASARPVCVNVACNFLAPSPDCTTLCHQPAACTMIGFGTFRCVPE